MRRDYYVAFCLVNVFALFGLLGGIWLHARQPARGHAGSVRRMPRWKRGGGVVFDEPLVNYVVGVEKHSVVGLKEPAAVPGDQSQPNQEAVEKNTGTPQSFPRVFEQRDILVDDPRNHDADTTASRHRETKKTEAHSNNKDVMTTRVQFPSHDFVPFTVIGSNPVHFLKKSKSSFEREVHKEFTAEIWHVKNHSLRVPLPDCGSSSQLSSFITDTSHAAASVVIKKAAIALAPQVWSWQHFVQDAMPKIVSMLDLGLIDHSRPLLLPPPRDAIIPEILKLLNLTWIPEPRSGSSFYAEDIVIACHVPGAHPRLWRGVRRVLTSIAPIVSQRYLVYLSRKNAHNGRKETNYQELRKMLQNTFHGESREFTGGKLLDVIRIFAGADIIVGSHGGGLYNSLFATENSCVVEQQSKNVYLHNSNREIFHRITTQIGQRYIRVIRDDGSFDFHIEHLREAVLSCLSMNDSRNNHLHSSAEMKTLEQNVTSKPDNVATSNSRDDYLKPTDKVDFVIPWINYSMGYTESKTTPFDFGAPLYNIVSEFGLKRQPWTEICWSVRSILYYGGPSIGTIYIVYNAHRHPAPACNFQNSQVVSLPQQKFLQHTVLDHPNMSSPRPHAVLQFVHQIRDLRNFFIFSMDDIFLLKRFQVTDFYDFTRQKILTHMTAGRSGISPGTAYGASELEKYFKRRVEHGDGLHVPFMVRRKSQEKLTEALAHLFSHCAPPVHLCDFGTHYQSLVQNFMILEGVAENRAPSQFSEIHTTSSTRLYQALTQSRATWLDVQGTGVSDEYGGDEPNRIRIREEFDRWLQEQAFYRNVEQRTREGTHAHRHHEHPCTTLQDLHTVAAACAQQYRPPGPDALCHANHPLHHHAWLHRITSDLTLPTATMVRTCPVLSFPSTPQRFASIEFKCYSQNTEDGILLAIFAAIGTTNKRAVEIAGGLGWENNAINLVVNFGFDALFFDGDPGNTRCAKNFLRQHEATRDRVDRGVWWSSDFVTRENINALIYNTTQWEGEIDLFSLDMDGVDWWIWDALVVVRPRVVVVEIQELWGPDEIKTRPYRADHVSPEIAAMGASLGAFAWLAAEKGYRLVGCIKQGFNAFFVREDVPGVDAVFGRGQYAREGCFAHVDDAWRGVLEERRKRAGGYDWVDPRPLFIPDATNITGYNIADTTLGRMVSIAKNMYQKTTHGSAIDRVWYAVVALPSYDLYPKTGNLRRDNIARMKRVLPEMQVFQASHNLDASCIDILRKLNVTVSPKYYSEERGYGWIHGGKIGHWCSFLRFISHCAEIGYGFCVWMEDDLKLTNKMVGQIKTNLKDGGMPIVSLGVGDEANIIIGCRVQDLLNVFKNYEIQYPLDLAMMHSGYRDSKKIFDGRLFHDRKDSTLVCPDCELLYYADINKKTCMC